MRPPRDYSYIGYSIKVAGNKTLLPTYGQVVKICDDLSLAMGTRVKPEAISEGGFLVGGRIGSDFYKSVRFSTSAKWPLIPVDVDALEWFRSHPADEKMVVDSGGCGRGIFFKARGYKWTAKEVAKVIRVFHDNGIKICMRGMGRELRRELGM